MKSTEEMEQAAKRWEVAALSEQVKALSEMVKAVSGKLDVLMSQQHITEKQVDDKIESAKKDVFAKYDPVYGAVKWLGAVLGVAVVGQVVYITFQLLGKS